MLLTIDMRKSHDGGIGTYIRQVVPRVVRAWPRGSVQVLVNRGETRALELFGHVPVRAIELATRPLAIAEQGVLRQFASSDRLLWATSLAHPLFTQGRLVSTVHDLAQLALPAALGGTWDRRLLARPVFESIRRCAEQVMHVSDFTAAEFRRLVGAPLGGETVTPLGVDAAEFAPRTERSERSLPGPYFLMVGNLRPHKNLPLVLEALERAGAALPHRLMLVGPDQGSTSLMTQLRQRHGAVADRITLAGSLGLEGLRVALQHAEALVFASHYEGFGLPVLEAMAAGCPVLVARNGVSTGIAGDQALNFDPNDAAGLAAAMCAQVNMPDPERRGRVRAGMERAANARWDRTAELTLTVLDVACGRRRSRRTGALTA